MAPKILLLVNSSPSGEGVGELFLREIGSAYPVGRLVRFSTVQNATDAESAWLGFRSIERNVNISRWPVMSTISELRFGHEGAAGIATEIASIVASEEIDIVWSVLSSGPTIAITDELASLVRAPLVATVLDDPNYFLSNQMVDGFTKARAMSRFARVLKRSQRVSVIGEAMQDAYKRIYGIDSIVLRHGIHESQVRDWNLARSDSGEFIIGFAGSLYAKKEWNAFTSAIEDSGGIVGGREVSIKFIGRFPRFGARLTKQVRCLGTLPFAATLNEVSAMDAAYLPYWFGGKHSIASRTSFPGKLSAYAAAGVPVFYHAPEDASATAFLREYPFGVCCRSLRSEVIVSDIGRLIADADFLTHAPQARASAMAEELGREVMLARFCQLIDGNPAQLLGGAHD